MSSQPPALGPSVVKFSRNPTAVSPPERIIANLQPDMTIGDVQVVMLQMEIVVVERVLRRTFGGLQQALVKQILQSLYPSSVTAPRFLPQNLKRHWPLLLEVFLSRQMSDSATPAPSRTSPSTANGGSHLVQPHQAPVPGAVRPWCRLVGEGCVQQHFAKALMPPIRFRLITLDGQDIPRVVKDGQARALSEIRVRVTVMNKWADVTAEVAPETETVFSLIDGAAEMADLKFMDISLRHGGVFYVRVCAIDNASEIVAWQSGPISIQSVKTHSNKRRRKADSTDQQLSEGGEE